MTASNITDNCDHKVATREYEVLRSNALGNINQAVGFTLFLRNGMRVWLREFSKRKLGRQKMHQELSPVFTEEEMPATEMFSILADAILNIPGEDKHDRGNP